MSVMSFVKLIYLVFGTFLGDIKILQYFLNLSHLSGTKASFSTNSLYLFSNIETIHADLKINLAQLLPKIQNRTFDM